MRKMPLPALLLALFAVIFLGSLAVAAVQMPERVATHFNAAGNPNGWMSLRQHLLILGIGGTLLPAILATAFYGLRFTRAERLRIPNREHWLAPERRAETFAWLFRHALWFDCLWLAFFTAIGLLILQANTVHPPRLAPGPSLALGAGFTAGVILWGVCMIRRFMKRK